MSLRSLTRKPDETSDFSFLVSQDKANVGSAKEIAPELPATGSILVFFFENNGNERKLNYEAIVKKATLLIRSKLVIIFIFIFIRINFFSFIIFPASNSYLFLSLLPF